jgi:DNA-binding Xre family transcriptional regulator
MDLSKSIRVALALRGKSQKWLAEEYGVSRQWISHVKKAENVNTNTIKTIAEILDMPVSEFIALGE